MKFSYSTKTLFFRSLSAIIVFGLSFSIPIFIFQQLKISAYNTIIQQNMESFKNWAMIYNIKKNTYQGLLTDINIIKEQEEIKKIGSKIDIYIDSNGQSYCAKTNFIGLSKNKIYCVDSFGYSGYDGYCGSLDIPKCK
ncbi:MAG TPA: hypothetical protein PL093_00355 [Candidatus Pacearchaeota archaeon]|nr:hypothetical protein [Candidatus Pacearchaeota archaeon]HRR94637.1 hypothetical protein [Candidatus Paceibacterota bacterium]HPC30343.1 hypothetical protein [Candidatus Pacearchaeota archaeon]HQG09033.1 hypothetical protein [Candidatus Pacearchaeota archaeon]HQH20014.1 hypothetical protein [Candidatus Pacearchaeota archaeon]